MPLLLALLLLAPASGLTWSDTSSGPADTRGHVVASGNTVRVYGSQTGLCLDAPEQYGEATSGGHGPRDRQVYSFTMRFPSSTPYSYLVISDEQLGSLRLVRCGSEGCVLDGQPAFPGLQDTCAYGRVWACDNALLASDGEGFALLGPWEHSFTQENPPLPVRVEADWAAGTYTVIAGPHLAAGLEMSTNRQFGESVRLGQRNCGSVILDDLQVETYAACRERWSCSGWRCVNETHATRSCTDASGCARIAQTREETVPQDCAASVPASGEASRGDSAGDADGNAAGEGSGGTGSGDSAGSTGNSAGPEAPTMGVCGDGICQEDCSCSEDCPCLGACVRGTCLECPKPRCEGNVLVRDSCGRVARSERVCPSGCLDGKCVAECRLDEDCSQDQRCSAGRCARLECACGYPREHRCEAFECCSDAECGDGAACVKEFHRCAATVGCVPLIDRGPGLDVLFVGAGYSLDELRSDARALLQGPQGMFSTKPFDTARVNAWLIAAPDYPFTPCPWPELCGESEIPEPSAAVFQARCPHADATVVVSQRTFDSFGTFGGAAYLSLGSYSGDKALYRGRLFLHEFGHSFGLLADEYLAPSRGDQARHPNCAPDIATAMQWWTGAPYITGVMTDNATFREDGGCAYVAKNVRPHANSIMRNFYDLSVGYGEVSERWLQERLSSYR